jgi:ankyrin repeat protein
MRYHLDHGLPQSVCTSISIGDLPRARALLAAHPSAIHERGPHDFALLWYAAIGGGSVEAAELLLDAGVEVDQESQGTTALHWAADRGQLDLARFLAERGADVDALGYKFDRNGQRPIQLARESGHDDMVKLLEDLGAS